MQKERKKNSTLHIINEEVNAFNMFGRQCTGNVQKIFNVLVNVLNSTFASSQKNSKGVLLILSFRIWS